ncbi:MAG: hypothetical protein HKN17_09360 [Rhodothermales bacterium]|nr:hypothetical protein [Rhodothermales bacterium]
MCCQTERQAEQQPEQQAEQPSEQQAEQQTGRQGEQQAERLPACGRPVDEPAADAIDAIHASGPINFSKMHRGFPAIRILSAAVLFAVILLPSAEAWAQARGPAERSAALIDAWFERQHESLGDIESIAVRTTVRHAIDTSVSTRVATYAADLTLHLPDVRPGDPAGPPLTAEPPRIRRPAAPGPGPSGGIGPDVDFRLLWMTLDGDTLQTAHARRVLQRLRTMLRPESIMMMDEIGIPAAQIARLDPIGAPETDRIGDRPALRIDATPAGSVPRRLRVSLWLDESGERLVATRLLILFPGNRRLRVFTEYQHVGGVDVPVARIVDGVVPVPRRGRDVSVALDHKTRFFDYEFRFKDR